MEIDGELYNDGGLQKQVNLSDAIDLGADEIDVILTAPEEETNLNPKLNNSIDILGRTVSIMSNKILDFNIKTCVYYNKLVENGLAPGKKYVKLNILRPKENLIEDSMDFSPESIKRMFDIGYELAKSNFVK
jgi:predicted patatin/cPLA2 family phospholipase